MSDVIDAFYMTWPLWAFVITLAVAAGIEEGVVAYGRRKIKDNPALR